MTFTRSDEEFLRELASLGDLNQIKILFDENVNLNVNSQNAMNGWTALHWAAKRNHRPVVEFLLEKGAIKTIEAHDRSLAVDVCSNETLKSILQVQSADRIVSISPATLPIVPNYLRNPVFPYVSTASNVIESQRTESATITLLCRIADDSSETDFVEFDFNKLPNFGSYDRLVEHLRSEFQSIDIEKIRRLPNVRVRNDRDVERLKDNQMLEIIQRSTSNDT